ncbi:MAG TPA: single-stranded DNA-binding protein [Gemmataceae bacterium]|nr:single-stranded DNA-binding protein [Gemmataceae bacterium]
MANLNKVMLIGRLASDPEPPRVFPSGGAVTRFRFAVNYTRRKNPQTGQWEGEAVFIDVEAFNSAREGGRQLADLAHQHLKKGNQVFIEGRLRLNEWNDKDGQKRSKIIVVADSLEFLERREEGAGTSEGNARPPRMAPAPRKPANASTDNAPADGFEEPEPYEPPTGRSDVSDIPF